MSEIIYKTFRIKFEKTGVAKYISHLDLSRVFARSLARAGVEIMHSEGFNPRPKIVFASALSLGVESLCEFADIRVGTQSPLPPFQKGALKDEIYEKIKCVFPQGINIIKVYEAKNEFKNIDRTRYNIFLNLDEDDVDEIKRFFEDDVIVEKKPGIEINLKDYICGINISGELIDAAVKTNQEMFLNPENIIKGVKLRCDVGDYYIKKIEVFDKNNVVFE